MTFFSCFWFCLFLLLFVVPIGWWFLNTTSMHTNNHFEEGKVFQDEDTDLTKTHKYGTENMVSDTGKRVLPCYN